MIKIVSKGQENGVLVFEIEFDFQDEIHRLTIKKVPEEMLSYESKEEFLDYVKKVVEEKRTELLLKATDELVPLNEDIERIVSGSEVALEVNE